MASYRHRCGHYENRLSENYVDTREAKYVWNRLLCSTCYTIKMADGESVTLLDPQPEVLTHFGGRDLKTGFRF